MRFTWVVGAAMACAGDDGSLTTDGSVTNTDTTDEVPTTDTPTTDTDTVTDTDTDTTVPVDPCDAAPSILEVGVGAVAAEYQPLTGVQLITLVHGPQGGWHVETAAVIQTPSADGSTGSVAYDPTVTLVEDGTPIVGPAAMAYNIALAEWDPVTCTGRLYGQRAVLDYAPPTGGQQEFVCSLEGKEIRIDVSVMSLATAEVTTSSATGMVQLDSLDVSVCGGS